VRRAHLLTRFGAHGAPYCKPGSPDAMQWNPEPLSCTITLFCTVSMTACRMPSRMCCIEGFEFVQQAAAQTGYVKESWK
jgi:hypothetical protein